MCSGRVSEVGGLKEKVESVRHHGIKTLIVPMVNLEQYQREQGFLLQLACAALGTGQQEGPVLVGVRCLEEALPWAFEDPAGRHVPGREEEQAEEAHDSGDQRARGAGNALIF